MRRLVVALVGAYRASLDRSVRLWRMTWVVDHLIALAMLALLIALAG